MSLILLSALILSTAPQDAFGLIEQYDNSQQGVVWYDSSVCAPGGSVTLAGDTNIEKILNFFMSKGLSLAQASGFVGNIIQESPSGFDEKIPDLASPTPNIREGGQLVDEDYTPENGVGFGLVQWTWTARQAPLVEKAKEMGKPITDMGVQLEHIWDELNGSYSSTLEKIKTVDDPVDAAIIVHGATDATVSHPRFKAFNLVVGEGYEASGDSAEGVIKVRGGAAQTVYDFYKDSAPTGQQFTSPSGATQSTDPDAAVNASDGDGSGQGITIALDPGHGPGNQVVDEESGLMMSESNNQPEGQDVLDVSNRLKTMLEEDGYTVIMTKTESPGEDITFRDRANIAKDGGASLALSIHTTPGGPANNQATPQRMGTYREYNSKRLEFTNQKTADLSGQYAESIAKARSEVEGHPVNTDNIEMMRADLASKGTIPLVPLFSDSVPWVYNEIVQDTGTSISEDRKQKYAEGLYNGIKSANIQATSQPQDGCGGGSGAGGGFDKTLLDYAWEEYSSSRLDMKPAYNETISESRDNGNYAGDGRGDWGVDCGVFVTHLVRDSGHDKAYNYNGSMKDGAGPTPNQEKWLQENWEKIGDGPIDPAKLMKGDVAMQPGHTFIYVGEVPGFDSDVASASWGERAPMAGGNSPAESATWYRKK